MNYYRIKTTRGYFWASPTHKYTRFNADRRDAWVMCGKHTEIWLKFLTDNRPALQATKEVANGLHGCVWDGAA